MDLGGYLSFRPKCSTIRPGVKWSISLAEVNLHEAFWTDDQCLIVMDLAHGGNLFDKLHKDIMDCQRDPFPGLGGKEFSSKHVAAQLLLGDRTRISEL